MFQSLRARLIALSVAIVTVAMLALAIANFLTVQRHVLSTLDDQSRQLVNAQAQVLGEWVATKRLLTQAEDGIRDDLVTGVQTCALPI